MQGRLSERGGEERLRQGLGPGTRAPRSGQCPLEAQDLNGSYLYQAVPMDEQKRRNMQGDGVENSIQGKGKDLKGRVKGAAGSLTGDSSLEAEGKMDRVEGKIQEKVGDMQRKLSE